MNKVLCARPKLKCFSDELWTLLTQPKRPKGSRPIDKVASRIWLDADCLSRLLWSAVRQQSDSGGVQGPLLLRIEEYFRVAKMADLGWDPRITFGLRQLYEPSTAPA